MGFRERMYDTINQGLKSSRELFDKAKEKAKDLGEKGVIKLEISQLENQAEKLLARLGTAVYQVMVEEEQNTISHGTPQIKEILADISDIRSRIEHKETLLKNSE